jgi:DNA-binding transcriptional LysR family regulator
VPDLRRLQYFLAVAQERNFTRAAQRLRIAQPALSRQVRQLERELGVDLLRRTTHEFELTEAGTFLLERGPALLTAADRLWRETGRFGTGARGSVVFAYGASASYETAPKLLEELADRFPEVQIETRVLSVAAIVKSLGEGSVDIGLVRCPPALDTLEVRPVRNERQGLLVCTDHRLAGHEAVHMSELSHEHLLLHPRDANPGHYDSVLALCREHGVEPQVVHRSVSFDLVQTPVLDGRAVAIVGESTESSLPDALRWVPLTPPVALDVAVLVPRHNRSAVTDRLLSAAIEIANGYGWVGDAAAS